MSGKGFEKTGQRGQYIGIIAIAIAETGDEEGRRKIVSQIVRES
jgi:hypothetical protein